MRTESIHTQRFVSYPRTKLEQSVFTACEVSDQGMRLFVTLDGDGALTLPTSAAVAVLDDLVQSARRRLLDLEFVALPKSGGGNGAGAAGDALGTAGEAGPGSRPPP